MSKKVVVFVFTNGEEIYEYDRTMKKIEIALAEPSVKWLNLTNEDGGWYVNVDNINYIYEVEEAD